MYRFIVSVCKQTVELDLPYATFFRSAMQKVNGASSYSNKFVRQWTVQTTVQWADESVPRELPVIVAKPRGEPDATVTYGMSKPTAELKLPPIVGGRWQILKRSCDVGEVVASCTTRSDEHSFHKTRHTFCFGCRSFKISEFVCPLLRLSSHEEFRPHSEPPVIAKIDSLSYIEAFSSRWWPMTETGPEAVTRCWWSDAQSFSLEAWSWTCYWYREPSLPTRPSAVLVLFKRTR